MKHIASLYSFCWTAVGAILSGSSAAAAIPAVDLELTDEGILYAVDEQPLAAFDQLAYAMSLSYALSAHKEVDWDARYDALRPEVAAAVARRDWTAYFRLVRSFALSTHDGHVTVQSEALQAYEYVPSAVVDGISGDFGVIVLRTDDGRLRLFSTTSEQSLFESGAELLAVDGVSAETAWESAPTAWINKGIATSEARDYFRGLALGLGRLGAKRSFRVKGPDGNQEFQLQATTLGELPFPGMKGSGTGADPLIDGTMLNETTGYLRIPRLIEWDVLENPSSSKVSRFLAAAEADFSDALEALDDAGAENLILDLRGNIGGMDALGARLAGFFATERTLYNISVPFDFETIDWDSDAADVDWTMPRADRFSGRVVVLADHQTISAGEGLVDALAQLPQVRFVGFWGTNGSYADTGGVAILPGGVVVQWPIDPCVRADGAVKIDAGPDAIARLIPEVRIPHTRDHLVAVVTEGEEVELEWALQTLEDPLFGYFPGASLVSDDWSWHSRFGWMWTGSAPWVYHLGLGWIYLEGKGGRDALFYRLEGGWCWSSTEAYPWVYSYLDGWYRVD